MVNELLMKDAQDGEWIRPTVPNPNYKGEWKPNKIANPEFKGKWQHPKVIYYSSQDFESKVFYG